MGKSNERILCKLSKSEILGLYSIVYVAMETAKTPNFSGQLNLSSVYFSLVKFQLVSCNLPCVMIWQMTYTHKLPKLSRLKSNKEKLILVKERYLKNPDSWAQMDEKE